MPGPLDPAQILGDSLIATYLSAGAPEIAGIVVASAGILSGGDVLGFLEDVVGHFPDAVDTISNLLTDPINLESHAVGSPFVKLLITNPLGIDAAVGPAGAGAAIDMLNTTFGFAAQLPIATTVIGAMLKPVLGHRAPELMDSTLGLIGEEFGLPFFIGSVLANLFEHSVGPPLEEAVNIVHRPARFNPNQVIKLLRAHSLDDGTARDLLAKTGFRDEDIDQLMKLDRAFLPMGDLQQASLLGLIDDAYITDHLQRAGFEDADIALMVQLIAHKATTEGGAILRSVAHTGFREGHLSEGQFRAILAEANVPQASIELEVEGINLQRSWQTTTLSVAQLKQAFQHGDLDLNTILMELVAKGYSANDATILANIWADEHKTTNSSYPIQRILAYLLSGVLTKEQASFILVAQGMPSDQASFLVDHPAANGGVYQFSVKPQTIYAAVKDEIISVDTAMALLSGLNVDPAEATLQVQIAVLHQAKPKVPKQSAKTLTEAQYMAAFENGLIADTFLLRALVGLGYSEADAQLLVATQFAKDNDAIPEGWQVLT